jgi:hypothetical protein
MHGRENASPHASASHRVVTFDALLSCILTAAVEFHTECLLHAKRHLKLRSLTSAPSISRDQMLEASERLSRIYGSLRDVLHGTQIRIGEEYECDESDGTIAIQWNWT